MTREAALVVVLGGIAVIAVIALVLGLGGALAEPS
jgi:hypothetical protein